MKIKHIAIIMDGNRRWAKEQGLTAAEGHRAGVETLAKIVKFVATEKIPYLTVYALSSENLAQRDKKEILALFSLIKEGLQTRLPELNEEGVKITFFGDLSVLPSSIKSASLAAFEKLQNNKRLQLNIALNYGGRAEITRAAKKIIEQGIKAKEVSEDFFTEFLFTKSIPDPDLIIRTGGEKRLSNFLLWQAAYSELFFTDTLWPAFTPEELTEIIGEFEKRKRNFGK